MSEMGSKAEAGGQCLVRPVPLQADDRSHAPASMCGDSTKLIGYRNADYANATPLAPLARAQPRFQRRAAG